MALRRVSPAAAAAVALAVTAAGPLWAAASPPDDPSFLHGAGQVLAGVLFELPKTLLDATLTGPPVVGTMVGLFAGTARALQVTVAGVLEMSAGFKPFGGRRRRR